MEVMLDLPPFHLIIKTEIAMAVNSAIKDLAYNIVWPQDDC